MDNVREKNREEELTEVISYITRGAFCQLIGVPGVGREHVFSLLTSNKHIREEYLGEHEKQHHFVLVDFAELREKPISEVVKLLFLELSDSLRDREYAEDYKKVKSELDTSLRYQDGAVLLQGLKRSVEYLAKEKNLHITFLFDRFEEYISSVSDEFFVSLSSLRNRAGGKFSVVFALTRPLEHSIEPEYFKDAYDLLAGNRVYMKLYDRETIDAVFEREEASSKQHIPKEIREGVIGLTGGHRKMTILALEELIRSDFLSRQERLELTELLLDSLSIRSVSYQIWNSLRPQEQLLLKKQIQHEGARVFETEDEEKRIRFLTDVGLLREYRFAITLFASFVLYRVEHKLDDKLHYKPEEKRVYVGEQDITDTFTAYEKKALFFFLEHQGKILGRDEIISAVWKDQATTDGVTDQALDQLIYRLRRKIEPDFGNPHYLQTIKGQGFKFML